MLLDGLAGLDEGSTLARLGELVLEFVVRLDVEILYPGTAAKVRGTQLSKIKAVTRLKWNGIEQTGWVSDKRCEEYAS